LRALRAAVLLDVRLQARSKLYHIGVAVALLFGLACRLLFSEAYIGRVLSVYYLAAVGGTTYMFGASMVLFEKSERTLEALRVSPMPATSYLASKALTLSAFAVVEAVLVLVLAVRGAPVSPMPLLAGIVVLGGLYTFVGVGQVATQDSVTGFIFPGALIVSLVLSMPFLYVLGVEPSLPIYLVPTQAPLLLILAAFEPITAWQWLYAVVASLVGVGLAFAYALARFREHIRFGRA
jgi:fluoroquinolone transport system permease protein